MTDDILRGLLDHLAGVDDRSLWSLLLVILAVIVLRARLPPTQDAPPEGEAALDESRGDPVAGDDAPPDGPSSPSHGPRSPA